MSTVYLYGGTANHVEWEERQELEAIAEQQREVAREQFWTNRAETAKLRNLARAAILKAPDYSEAPCQDYPDFYHEPIGKQESAAQKLYRESLAKDLCGTCNVLEQCKIFNLAEPEGVWGGMDKKERDTLRKELGISKRSERVSV